MVSELQLRRLDDCRVLIFLGSRGSFDIELALANPPRAAHSSSICTPTLPATVSLSSFLLDFEWCRCLPLWCLLLLLALDREWDRTGCSSRNKHMTAQSSILEPGYLCFQALTARFTNNLAAVDLLGAEATMFITSWLVSTSHICKEKERKQKFNPSIRCL